MQSSAARKRELRSKHIMLYRENTLAEMKVEEGREVAAGRGKAALLRTAKVIAA